MNIIESWEIAKEGQEIRQTSQNNRYHPLVIKREGKNILSSLMSHLYDVSILADDWEIVKEHKRIETTWHSLTTHKLQCYPHDAKVVIEWDE